MKQTQEGWSSQRMESCSVLQEHCNCFFCFYQDEINLFWELQVFWGKILWYFNVITHLISFSQNIKLRNLVLEQLHFLNTIHFAFGIFMFIWDFSQKISSLKPFLEGLFSCTQSKQCLLHIIIIGYKSKHP